MFQLERTAQLWGITGNLGGGKSLTAVQFAVDAMSQGYFVCTNITLNQDLIAAHYGDFTRKLYLHISLDDPTFDAFKLPTGSPRGSGGKKRVLVILDECAEWVDQYSSAKDPRIARLWSWLRHSSKRSQDVFIIVQRPDYLNKVIRILITRWIWVHDLAVWRVPVLKLRLPFFSHLVMRNIFDNLKNRIGAASFASKSYWGQFYNTAECLNSDGATYNVEYDIPEVKRYGRFWIVCILILSQFLLFHCLFRPPVCPDSRFPDESPPDIIAISNTFSRANNALFVKNPPEPWNAAFRPWINPSKFVNLGLSQNFRRSGVFHVAVQLPFSALHALRFRLPKQSPFPSPCASRSVYTGYSRARMCVCARRARATRLVQ